MVPVVNVLTAVNVVNVVYVESGGCSAGAGVEGDETVFRSGLITPLIQLLANPEKFNGANVTVRGYLVAVGGHGDIAAHFLYLSRDDAQNMLGDAVVVVMSDQMRRDEEKIDRMYVSLTGTLHAVPTANGGSIPTIKDVVSCTVWSDPSHPIGLKEGLTN